MANPKICDFCLSESTGLFHHHTKLEDGHYICKNCKETLQEYNLPIKFELFQLLVTAQSTMIDMIMDAWLENHPEEDSIAKFYPYPSIPLHDGEHCLNAVKATYTVMKDAIPEAFAPNTIGDIQKSSISNVPDAVEKTGSEKVTGMLYETEAALYFISEHIINVHRLGYMKRNTKDSEHIIVQTPAKKFTYAVEHADLFFMRERFFQKINARQNNKHQHLIYISDDNQLTITPGIYDIPRALKPGVYKVKAIKDAGLHMRDPLGHVRDYYENEDSIDLSAGGTLECTGEYKLEWIGEKKK